MLNNHKNAETPNGFVMSCYAKVTGSIVKDESKHCAIYSN